MRNVIITRLGRRFEITGHPPVGNVGSAYSYTFGTTGGVAPITWTCTSLGASGASFSAGTLSSVSLLTAGVFPFTLTATDSNRQIATATFNLIIIGAGASQYVMALEGSAGRLMGVEGSLAKMRLQ